MRSAVLPRGVATLAAALLATSLGIVAPTVAAPSSPPAHPDIVAASTTLSFRLPELVGRRHVPNARNLAMRSRAGGPLLLFLPATGAVPGDYRAFLDTASALGYHVLGLDYWNVGLSVARTCGPVASCYGQVQANRLDGRRPGPYSSVSPADSILSRLADALAVLRTRDPAGGWGRYLSSDRVRWNRIVVAGHSQGGGESAYIAHLHRVQGVLLFASPVSTDGPVVPSWMSHPGATPTSRYFGFDDVHDVYFNRIQAAWTALAIGAHRVLSRVDLGTPGEAHGRLVADDGPRTARGVPLFQPIWRRMLVAVQTPADAYELPRVVS